MPEENPLVTICIPTHNRADTFLPAALSAACNQTYQNLEILVSDNASSDGTEIIVKRFNDHRIRYYLQDSNIGSAKNIDFCIQNSHGKYTLLLMDDDLIDADFIECCVRASAIEPEAGLIRTGVRVVDSRGSVIHSIPNLVGGLSFTEFVIAWTKGKTLPFMCSTLFRTLPLREVGMNSRYHCWDDVICEFEIACRYGRIDIPDIKATYSVHPDELSFKESALGWIEDSRELINLVCKLAPNDADLLQHYMTPHLVAVSYAIVAKLRKPWTTRLREAILVYRTFGILPNMSFFTNVFSETLWFSVLRAAKRRAKKILS